MPLSPTFPPLKSHKTSIPRVIQYTNNIIPRCVCSCGGGAKWCVVIDEWSHAKRKVTRHLFQESFNTPTTTFLGAYAAIKEEQSGVWWLMNGSGRMELFSELCYDNDCENVKSKWHHKQNIHLEFMGQYELVTLPWCERCESWRVNLQSLGQRLGLTWILVSDTVELDLKAVIRRLKRWGGPGGCLKVPHGRLRHSCPAKFVRLNEDW